MIKLTDVKKTYKSGSVYIEALKNINLEIKKGDMIVIGGVSGSGKSTLLNLIGAMDKATAGKIMIDDEDLTRYSMSKLTAFRARKVGFIFQSFHLIPVLNIYENIIVPMKLKGQRVKKNKVLELIERVGLSNHIKHKPDELSGGQRQRVSIARALVHNPPYVMADEPTANLDSVTAQNIVRLLKELNKNLNITIIFASHDPAILENIDKKMKLKDGMIIE
jgi:putative ABC transport system ATP-binding protein